jgi:Domain of unknown function (DUF4328)
VSTPTYRLQPPGALGRWLRILLLCVGGWSLVVDVVLSVWLAAHPFVMDLPSRGNDPPPIFVGEFPVWVRLLWLPSLVSQATIVLWLVWQHRMTANLWARDPNGLRITPGWAVGWWFIPFASLGMPLVAMLELDRRSTPTGVPRRASPLVGWWWAAWVAQQVLPFIVIVTVAWGPFSRVMHEVDRYTRRIDFTPVVHAFAPWLAVAGIGNAVAAVLAYLVVRRIDQAQAEMIGVALAPPPRPDVVPT